jgi:hypothetical protein
VFAHYRGVFPGCTGVADEQHERDHGR